MEIIDMKELSETLLCQAARMLTDELPIGWPGFDDAMEEIHELFAIDGSFHMAATEKNEVVGWCAIQPSYGGRVYELHPLVVRGDSQRRGIGSALVRAAEYVARENGGLTLWLGADDEKPGGETSFANADLFDDLPEKIRNFKPGTHQTAFYLKVGFKITGVMPDANGLGKPDIYMAKRL